ncbi:MAG TPA: platelet-activating factor acetylhydrolase IB subunit [Desulfuromonadaceae bacterium]|nr:platelet-activating factor acetylhydrolase IB subunit [Desulfuromonadaceae bacterium]
MKTSHLGIGIAACLAFAGCSGHGVKTATPRPAPPAQTTAIVSEPASVTNKVTGSNSPAYVPSIRTTSTNWMARHEKFVEQAKAGNIDLLFQGDSITDFWRTRGSNVWNEYYAPKHAADFGIGGDRTQHVLWRMENGELDGIHPKVIVLMIGTNNSGTDPADDIARAIRRMVEDIRSKLPETKVLLLGVFPRGPHRGDDGVERMKVIHAVNEQIATLDDGKMVKYLDIGDKFLGPDGKIPDDVMPDQLHPSEKGYRIWADAMNPTLDAMMQ